MHLKQPWTLDENKARIFHSNAASQGHPDATLLQKSPPSLVGSRVQLYGLKNSAELNGIHGVILRFDAESGRFAVKKEMVLAAESPTVTVKARFYFWQD